MSGFCCGMSLFVNLLAAVEMSVGAHGEADVLTEAEGWEWLGALPTGWWWAAGRPGGRGTEATGERVPNSRAHSHSELQQQQFDAGAAAAQAVQ